MDEALRFGLIGCGNIAGYGHRPAFQNLDEVKLVAVADVTAARRAVAKDWFGLPERDIHADWRELLQRGDLDAVSVTVPQGLRREIVLEAFAAGLHVLCEKPIATTATVAHELARAAHAAGRQLGIAHNYLYLPEFETLHRLLGAGEIGDLRVFTLHFLGVIDRPGAAGYRENWRHTMAAGGGILLDMIHAVYLAEWFFGAPAEQVMAFIDAPTYAHRGPEVEDLALAQVAFPGGYAALHVGWGEGVGGADLSGSAGHLRMRYLRGQTSGHEMPAEIYSISDWQRRDHAFASSGSQEESIARSFTRLYTEFARALRDEGSLLADGGSGARSLEVVLGAYLSAVTGQTVPLPLEPQHPVSLRGIAGLREVAAWPHSRTLRSGILGLRK